MENFMSFTFENVIEMWKTDATINENKIPFEITRTPLLHAKYLEIFMVAKAKLIVAEKNYNRMKWVKRKYFRGELEKHELDQYGWSQWQGLKPSLSELNELFDADRELNDLSEKVKYYQSFVSGIEYIMKQIQGRDWTLKTLSEHLRWTNG